MQRKVAKKMYSGRLHRSTVERDNMRYLHSVFGPLTAVIDYGDFVSVAALTDTEQPLPVGAAAAAEAAGYKSSAGAQSDDQNRDIPEGNTDWFNASPPIPVSPNTPKIRKAVGVKSVDLCIDSNTYLHNTSLYEQTKPRGGGGEAEEEEAEQQLLVRRGQKFIVKVTLGRPYDQDKDDIKVIFEIGDEPLVSKGTLVEIPVTHGCPRRKWGCSILHASPDAEDSAAKQSGAKLELELELQTPPDVCVGKWRLMIVTAVKGVLPKMVKGAPGAITKKILRYKHAQPVYVLFNPWCKDEHVYIEDVVLRDECVVNNMGKIFNGNSKQVNGRPWSFGQYKPFMLDCALHLLDVGGLRLGSVRGSPVHVVRSIAAACNSQDNKGVLVGDWSGDYADGMAPSKWLGSARILKQYWDTKEPVKYGQCWVFSGIVTSVCRALGIPARCVTNFASAHDCDGSMTIDTHWGTDGKPIDYLNEDSVWNFHVWNEAWMARPELPSGFGGWQAFDATPQETSEGMFRSGPASVLAIKRGEVNLPFDGPFIFAEVNADRVQWLQQVDGTWHTKITKSSIGKRISTHRPRKAKRADNPMDYSDMDFGFKDDENRLDITDQYKFADGTEDERAAMYRADMSSTIPNVHACLDADVRFELVPKDDIMVGSAFDILLKVQNKSRLRRTVHITITLSSVFYTGVLHSVVKSAKFTSILGAIKCDLILMRIIPDDYLHLIVDQVSFKISVLAVVEETKQVHAEQDDFRLRRYDPHIAAPLCVVVGQEFAVIYSFNNCTPMHLTDCSWMMEGPGIDGSLDVKHKDLDPFERCRYPLTLTATEAGRHQLICSFNTKELSDLTAMHDIRVDKF